MESFGRGVSAMVASVGMFASRTVYTASYALSYGVVYSAMMIARAVPADSALAQGLADGARMARDRAFGLFCHGPAEQEGAETHAGPAQATRHRRGGRPGGRRASH